MTDGADSGEPTTATTTVTATERDRTRPIGIVLLALFQVLNVTASLLALAGVLGPRTGSVVAVLGKDSAIVDVVVIVIAVLTLISAVGLWRLQRFGWYGIMLLTGLGLAIQIAFFVWATPNYINLTIYVVSAFYLNQHAVKSIFLETPNEPKSVVLAVEEDDQR